MKQLYPKKNPEDFIWHFTRHQSALTVENLHRKSDIAIQLAWRDAEIERLETLVHNLAAELMERGCNPVPRIRPKGSVHIERDVSQEELAAIKLRMLNSSGSLTTGVIPKSVLKDAEILWPEL